MNEFPPHERMPVSEAVIDEPLSLAVTVAKEEGRILYLSDPELRVNKTNDTLVIFRGNEKIRQLPVEMIEQVIAITGIQWSGQVLSLLMFRNIPVHFTTFNGRWIGQLRSFESKHVALRIAQLKVFESPRQLQFARAIVQGKMENMRTIVMRRSRGDVEGKDQRSELEALIRSAAKVQTIQKLMGVEGHASRLYFQLFKSWIHREEFTFQKRDRRPPKDPMNAMLSLGYTLLMADVFTGLQLVGLDPYVGYLHSLQYGRPSLALDLMEEFRSTIVDSMVLAAVNRGMFRLSDFEISASSVKLQQAARKQFYKLYEQRLSEEIIHPLINLRMSYRRIVRAQARIMVHAILATGAQGNYVPFVVR